MTTPKLYTEYPLTVKHIERNQEGNSLLMLINDTAAPVAPGDCFRWGKRCGTPSGTQWHFRMSDSVAYCEWPAPTKAAVVQP
jgi:hypothetical protein